jgi:2-isopropylmalate synthase
VLIEHHDGVRTWSTVGVSENMINASWQALSDGARYALLLRKVAGPARAEGKAG